MSTDVRTATIPARRRRRFTWRGLMAGVVLTPALLVALFSPPIVPRGTWPDFAIDVAAWTMFLAGAAMRFWATLYIGGRKDKQVVTDGPYSLVRHPLYLGSLFLAISAGLFVRNAVFAAALLLVVIVYAVATVPAEEGFLRETYGREYEDYSRRVRRYWPSFAHYRPATHLRVEVQALRREAARASRWVWLPVLGQLLTHLRSVSWWPNLFGVR